MEIRDLLASEFEREMKGTRATLERVPEGKSDYKPHEKSMSMSRLAGHLAQLPALAVVIVDLPELDFATSDMKPLVMESRDQLLQAFDSNVQKARDAFARTSDAALAQPWTLRHQSQVFLQGSRYEAIRGMLLNHIIHHRAQLGVYLRLNGVPVPSIYGPSADES
ncbi:MAG TPA: DinB family protein [Acidisarcina sp.]|nr:DinB family protein [Acidisarcina sp.]